MNPKTDRSARRTPRTLEGEFSKGIESGRHPCPENTEKAIRATVTKSTEPLIRAYWSGYLCQMTTDAPASL